MKSPEEIIEQFWNEEFNTNPEEPAVFKTSILNMVYKDLVIRMMVEYANEMNKEWYEL